MRYITLSIKRPTKGACGNGKKKARPAAETPRPRPKGVRS
jgi:hypothetical protein